MTRSIQSSVGAFLLLFSALAAAVCEQPAYRQFDFWIGEWTVTANDKLAGHNRISQDFNNCVLREQYITPSGYRGESFNIYDQTTGKWYQTWVDNGGTLLRLEGGLEGKAMVLSGPGKTSQGESIIHRITWTPNDDATVRQHWQLSKDDGKTWSTLFDGLYTKTQ